MATEQQVANSEVSPKDLMNIFALPAVLADHFFAGNSSGLIRLTFAEKTMGIEGSPAIPRATIVLTPYGVKQLRDLLSAIVVQIDGPQVPQAPEKEKLN